ncbi:MAG TPA: ABC transporter permease [Candidatus Portnoybacteria bacterium]|nr:ABC transporter permease [Candidatus Portnoybacteria bacterium]
MVPKKIYWLYSISAFLILWEVFVWAMSVRSFVLPAPSSILVYSIANSSLLLKNFAVTLEEIVMGLSAGVILGSVLSLAIARYAFCRIVFLPLSVCLQAAPIIALAPIVLYFFGVGMLTKVVVAAMMCFFPVVINFVKGLDSLDQDYLDWLLSQKFSQNEILFKARIPNSMPDFYAGLKIGLLRGISGVVIGEIIGSSEGLGWLVLKGNSDFEILLSFSAVTVLMITGLAIYLILEKAEDSLVKWNKRV